MKVLVLHNTGDGVFWEYKPDKAILSHAHTFDVADFADGPEHPLGLIYELTNVGTEYLDHHHAEHIESYDQQVKAYRDRGNRSTSVGDVIVVLEGEGAQEAFAVAKFGHEKIDLDLSTIDLTDIDNRLAVSLARRAHEAIDRHSVPNPFG